MYAFNRCFYSKVELKQVVKEPTKFVIYSGRFIWQVDEEVQGQKSHLIVRIILLIGVQLGNKILLPKVYKVGSLGFSL